MFIITVKLAANILLFFFIILMLYTSYEVSTIFFWHKAPNFIESNDYTLPLVSLNFIAHGNSTKGTSIFTLLVDFDVVLSRQTVVTHTHTKSFLIRFFLSLIFFLTFYGFMYVTGKNQDSCIVNL